MSPSAPHEPGSKAEAPQPPDEGTRDHPLTEPQKSYHTVLEQQITEAEEELGRSAQSLLISGFTAGLDVGFGPFLMAIALTLTRGTFSEPLQKLLTSSLYTFGFIFVVIGRSALYTEHTTSAIQPVFDGRNSIRDLLRLWGLVLFANLVGVAVAAWFAVELGSALHTTDAAAWGHLAEGMTSQSSRVIFFSAIGAGWLMGLLSWLTVAARDTTSQLILVWIPAFVIGIAGLHHCVAGSAEVLGGVFTHTVPLSEYFRFLAWSILGNTIGGSVMVSSLKFSHVKS